MSGNVRQRMIAGATEVLSRRGLHATAFSEVLALAGASRGSIYHHFPGGKTELIEAVLEDFGARLDEGLQSLHGRPAAEVVSGALDLWRAELTRNDCESSCPVAAVTIAADSSRLQLDGRAVLALWRDTLAAALKAGGCLPRDAHAFAALLMAAIQGATILSRAEGQPGPFDTVAEQLRAQAKLLVGY